MNWDKEGKPKRNMLDEYVIMTRKRFLLTNGIYIIIGALSFYILT